MDREWHESPGVEGLFEVDLTPPLRGGVRLDLGLHDGPELDLVALEVGRITNAAHQAAVQRPEVADQGTHPNVAVLGDMLHDLGGPAARVVGHISRRTSQMHAWGPPCMRMSLSSMIASPKPRWP